MFKKKNEQHVHLIPRGLWLVPQSIACSEKNASRTILCKALDVAAPSGTLHPVKCTDLKKKKKKCV